MTKIPDVTVKESDSYENCMDLPHVEQVLSPLAEMLEISKDDELEEWKKHWVGMPEFVNEKNTSKVYKSLKISFATKEDYEAFAKLVDQNLTDQTRSIWYPKLVVEESHLWRWIEDSE